MKTVPIGPQGQTPKVMLAGFLERADRFDRCFIIAFTEGGGHEMALCGEIPMATLAAALLQKAALSYTEHREVDMEDYE